MKKSFENAPTLREKALACKPVRHPGVREQKSEAGEIILCYPAAEGSRLVRWMLRWRNKKEKIRMKRLQLDEMGMAAWRLMDGFTSVQTIVNHFIDEFRMHPKEAEISVTAFVRELGRRGIIGLKEPSK